VYKIQSAAADYADQIEIDNQHSYGAALIDPKYVSEDYLIE